MNEITNRVCGIKERMNGMAEKMGKLKDTSGRTASLTSAMPHSVSSGSVGVVRLGQSYALIVRVRIRSSRMQK